ncbi:hypothetical protein SELMODRAFT_90428 [Selaginella moellendorffii]|uniref:F-box domain-containing protein n=2 Tax=Selaginella moellendorffii TaxID=88036 RepID=D8RCE8_SELML|nr:hypothetical protein SELMODRAFT_132039 [Selaginella moellendorffii]EFJ30117.1 hypothetical protein SELMODRAFT_90428 [Selaginella moellendorffii]
MLDSEEDGWWEAVNPSSDSEGEGSPGFCGTDCFDQLPDSLLVLILNKVGDIKVLGRCCAVSKRFQALAAHVEDVTVKVDCVISGEDCNLSGKSKGFLGQLMRLVFGSFVRPLQLLQHFLGPRKSAVLAEVSHHSPSEVLKSFKVIRHLRIELPGGELGIEEGVLLKWKAEFGSTLESCVILGAASMVEADGKWPAAKELEEPEEGGDGGCIPDSFYTDGGLKKRVVWTISSLIAASARHYLLQQIISDHLTLETLVLTDADDQGLLCMSKRQLHDFRDKPVAASASSSRTQVPDLNMKLWYAPSLSLPNGCSMKGVTLVAIRPSERPTTKEDDGFIARAFGEPFKTAACLLARRRTYLLEMNSF